MNKHDFAKAIACFQKALDLWASKVPYWMADQHVASHWITWDADGNPLIDGQRIYTEVPS